MSELWKHPTVLTIWLCEVAGWGRFISKSYICVYGCRSGEEARVGERGRECESETKIILYVFILF